MILEVQDNKTNQISKKPLKQQNCQLFIDIEVDIENEKLNEV